MAREVSRKRSAQHRVEALEQRWEISTDSLAKDRHVDIATPGNLGSAVRERIEKEAVTLFGRS